MLSMDLWVLYSWGFFSVSWFLSSVSTGRHTGKVQQCRQKKRLKGLLIAFSVGYLGAVDFLPALGIPIYPFGYLPIGFFIVVSAYIIMRYRIHGYHT